MAIQLKTRQTDSALYCRSKWWGNPDLPPRMKYPMMEYVDSDGNRDSYPLAFICQIDCSEAAPFDKEGLLPREGMLYFFAAIDYFLGHDCPESFPLGHWQKKGVAVRYARHVDEKSFKTWMVIDDDGLGMARPARAIEFSDGSATGYGHRLLGLPFYDDVREQTPGCISLLQVDEDDDTGLTFYDCGTFNIMLARDALESRNWKRAFGFLFSL